MTQIITDEKKLTVLLAEALDLAVDQTLFRGRLPASVNNAICLQIGDSDRGNDPCHGIYHAQLLGRYSKRDDALLIANSVDMCLPRYSAVCTILKTSSTGVYPTSWNGQDVWGVSCNLKIYCKQ